MIVVTAILVELLAIVVARVVPFDKALFGCADNPKVPEKTILLAGRSLDYANHQ